nr:MMPL family transporter [Streptomyces scabichelini]
MWVAVLGAAGFAASKAPAVADEGFTMHGSQVASAVDPFQAKAMSRDGTTAYATVSFKAGADDLTDASKKHLERAIDGARDAGLPVEVGGDTLATQPSAGGAVKVIGIAVATVVLLITFGSLAAAGLPLLTATLGVGVSVAGVIAASEAFGLSESTGTLATMLGLACGIDYALFVVSRYREECAKGHTPREATGLAAGTAGSAVVFAGLTVVIALAGQSVVGIPLLTKMGLAAAATVLVAVLVCLTLVPAVLGFTDPAMRTLYRDWADIARAVVARLRGEAARRPDDPRLALLVGELSVRDEDFRRWWADDRVTEKWTGAQHLHHPTVGDLTLRWDALTGTADRDQQLVVWTAEPGTPSHDALRLLVLWTVQSVQRAFDLLERIATHPEGARLSKLADGAGLNRSTAHNLLASLEGLGYITQDKKGAAYRLTGKLNRLLRLDAEAEHALRARIRPVLQKVSQASGESTFLAFATGTDYLCVDAVQSDQPLHLAIRPGERKPLIGEALGHALLTANADLAHLVRADDPDRWERHAQEIADAKHRGFALDLDSQQAGISCVAVAVTPRAAIAVAGPTNRLPEPPLITSRMSWYENRS